MRSDKLREERKGGRQQGRGGKVSGDGDSGGVQGECVGVSGVSHRELVSLRGLVITSATQPCETAVVVPHVFRPLSLPQSLHAVQR